VRIEAASVLTYLKEYLEGRLQGYRYPAAPFAPGTHGVGTIENVGSDVWHFRKGQRELLRPIFWPRIM
jgi:alcohol dehydrogenase